MKTLASIVCGLVIIGTTGRGDVPPGTYVGTSSTLVKYLDPNTLETVSQESFSRKLTVFVGDPKSSSGTTEANPFTLSVAPNRRTDSLTPGEVFAASARVFAVSGSPRLFQYWTLQNTATGFSGALTNNHSDLGLAKDRVVANFNGPGGTPTKFKMHDARVGSGLQCSLDAVVEGSSMALKIRGYAFVQGQAIIHFNTKVNALRTAGPAAASEPLDE